MSLAKTISIINFCLFTAYFPSKCYAQGVNIEIKTKDSAKISFTSETRGISFYIDSVYFGELPTDTFKLCEGQHIFKFARTKNRVWFSPELIDTVFLHANEDYRRLVNLPLICHITTVPYGATVRSNDSVIGTTPILFSISGEKALTLSKADYEDVTVFPKTDQEYISIFLKRRQESDSLKKSMYLSYDNNDSKIPLYMITGATIISGVTSAYFKLKADSYYQDYQRSGDAGILNRVNRYDTAAGISLAVCQLSLATLAYFLFTK